MGAVDDAPVAGDTRLYRRVHPNFVVWDDARNCNRLSSGAFNDQEMSVHLGDVLSDQGREPQTVLDAHPAGYFLAFLSASFVRDEEQAVVRSATDDDPSHGEVVGTKPKGRCRLFASEAKWEVAPEDPCPENVVA